MDEKRFKPHRALMAYGGYRKRRRRWFEESTITPLQLPEHYGRTTRPVEFEAMRRRPGREPNFESDVMVPLSWALFTWLCSFILSAYAAWAIDGLTWHIVIPLPIVAAFVTFFVAAGMLQKTLWIAETIFHADLDQAGEPDTELTVTVNNNQDLNRRRFIATLGVSPDKFVRFAKSALAGSSLAVNAWTGRNGLFTRSEYERLLAELERMELIERVNAGQRNSARALTDAGRQALEQAISG